MMLSALRQQKDRWIARLLLRYPSLFRAWEKRSGSLIFEDTPWQPLNKPIEQCKVALVTTGGVHLIHQPPFAMDNANGDHRFREIPAETSADQLKITHNYYDHRDADHDPNIVFPLERIQFLAQTGDIGSVNHRHFSFMGHIINEELEALMEVSAPEVARLLREDGVDVAILSPAWGICNQSVGLIQREIEKAGIVTISITLSKEISKRVKPPRSVYTAMPLGHPFSFPGQAFRQINILRLLLNQLNQITVPGTIIELDLTESDDPEVVCVTCNGGV